MARLTSLVAFGGLMTAAAGCGSSGSGGPIPFSQFEPTSVAAACHLEVLCGRYPDQATCLSSEQTRPHLYDTLGVDIASGKVIYDGSAARTCLDAVNALSICNRSTYSSFSAVDPTCSAIFTGTVAPGGACFFSEECAGQGTCASPCYGDACCAGTCASTTVALGDACSFVGAVCVSGTSCSGGTCQVLPGEGAPCGAPNYPNDCVSPLYCDSTTSTCKAPVATGGPCRTELGSYDCASALDLCDPTTATCKPLGPVGGPCHGNSSTIGCVPYATCDQTTDTCVDRPAVGAACDPNTPDCLGGTCDPTTNICTLTPTAGACS